MLGGDLNLVMDPILDRSSKMGLRSPKALLTVQRMCKTLGLADIWQITVESGGDSNQTANARGKKGAETKQRRRGEGKGRGHERQ